MSAIPKSYPQLTPLVPTPAGLKMDFEATKNGTLQRISDKELPMYELHIVDGKLFKGTLKKPLDTGNSSCMFVMHPDRKIYVGYFKRNFVHHTSLMGTKWPVAVGTLKAKQGTLTQITENSAQFLPRKRLKFVVDELRKQGASFSSSILGQKKSALPKVPSAKPPFPLQHTEAPPKRMTVAQKLEEVRRELELVLTDTRRA